MTTNHISWTEAEIIAHKRSGADEKSITRGDHGVLDEYFHTGYIFDSFLYTQTFRPNPWQAVLQHVGGITWIITNYQAARVLGFGYSGCITFAWLAFNTYLKTLFLRTATWKRSFRNPTNVVFDIIRMMPSHVREKYHRDISFFGWKGLVPNTWTQMILLTLLMMIAVVKTASFMYKTDPSGSDIAWVVADSFIWMIWPFHGFWVSLYFNMLSDSFRFMIKKFTIVEKDRWDRVDVKQCFNNYCIMTRTVARYTGVFANFFFIAEFTLLLAYLFILVAIYEESKVYNQKYMDKNITDNDTALYHMRLACLGVVFSAVTGASMTVFNAAKRITAATDKIEEAHEICCMPSQNDDPIRFYNHVNNCTKEGGFRAMGVVIDSSLAIRFGYLVSTICAFWLNYWLLTD